QRAHEESARVRATRTLCAALILLASVPVLLGWVIPPLGNHLPVGWNNMKANTALWILMGLGAVVLTEPARSRRSHTIGILLAVALTLMTAVTALQFMDVNLFRVDTLLASDPGGTVPGRPSLQACVGLFLIGVGTCSLGWRMAKLADTIAMLLLLFLLSFVGSTFFTREGIPGWSLSNQLARQSFFCLCLLAFLFALRRTERGGIFQIFRERGIGGRTARLAGPAALIFPFALSAFRELMIRFHLLSVNYAIALAPAVTALLALLFVLLVARLNGDLETALHDLSLRDELTGLYNRRGFNLLAEQAFHEAQRNHSGFSVIFLDVDDLKVINDTAGHDDGSRMLQQMAKELRHAFRITDIVGRVGGDEFLVAAKATQGELLHGLQRLQEAASSLAPQSFRLNFSYGIATMEQPGDTLASLIQRADARMYEIKRMKKGDSGPRMRA
ncbi:MAG: GGDEF domain-containing protein, partial [Terriglobus sp.]